ncbi:MAG: PrsW family intramembrane metalloprotease [Planctomycetes bacterium]|nr:PrsW family intramembrane metalloprotease [Planctomycetota bacterium]
MPISVTCAGCGKKLKAKPELAGKRVACPNCRHPITVPELPKEPEPPAKKKPLATPPLSMKEPSSWHRHLHWLLILALVPLAFSLLEVREEKSVFISKLKTTLDQAPPDVRMRLIQEILELEKGGKGRGSIENLFAVLPERKFDGAFLSRNSWLHWGFGAAAAVLFLGFLAFLASEDSEAVSVIFVHGLFTATVGIILLLVLQTLANWSQGVWMTGTGIIVILFYIVKLIGFSYQAAIDPDNSFFLSFLGYTAGVGFCEEACKALPLLWHYRSGSDQGWRTAFHWGLASGAGFGVAEGIMYSSGFYNGVSGMGDYFVRFISCVALHALWTGSVGITINQKQHLIQGDFRWFEYIPRVLVLVAVPMILHGLYDTFLKKNMSALALLVAAVSFVYLAFQISRLRGEDDKTAKDEMLKEYQRRKAALS